MRRFLLAALTASLLLAERLPVRVYTAADGLGDNSVHHVVRDSRGFLWFSTSDGVSRFDGVEFRTWTTSHGLQAHVVYRAFETNKGDILLATPAGVCRFLPSGDRLVCQSPEDGRSGSGVVLSFLQQDDDRVWVGTEGGLYSMREQRGRLEFEHIPLPPSLQQVALAESVYLLGRDSTGAVLLGIEDTLIRIRPGARPERLAVGFSPRGMAIEGDHSWFAASPQVALYQITPQFRLLRKLGKPDEFVAFDVLRQSSGSVWLSGGNGLNRIDPEGWTNYGAASGVGPNTVESLAEDIDGNLWAATDGSGAVKISATGITSFGSADGLLATDVMSIFETSKGELIVVTRSDSRLYLNRLDGTRFHPVAVNLPPGSTTLRWRGMYRPVLEGEPGEWWVASEEGVFRFTGIGRIDDLASAAPSNHFTVRDGLPVDQMIMFHRDGSGQIWIVSQFSLKNPLFRFDRRKGVLEPWPFTDGMQLNRPNAIAADSAGNLWLGLYRGGLLLRHNGNRLDRFTQADGVPAGRIHALHSDRSGHLWAGTGDGGLARIDQPNAPRPSFRTYTRRDGLSSEMAYSLTEDLQGRIYIGNGHGVDRLNPPTGEVEQFGINDGLIAGEAHISFRDRNGAIWIGTSQGVSRMIPSAARSHRDRGIRVVAVRSGNQPMPLHPGGTSQLTLPDLSSGFNTLQIDYSSPNFSAEPVRYRFRLDGSSAEWSPPTAQRSVLYAGLSPGAYRFTVETLDAKAQPTGRTASVAFTLLPPWWRSTWFLLLAASAIAALVYLAYQYRVHHLIELERVRLHIATDLHDDIGSGLTHIAILSELTQRGGEPLDEALPKIATLSRDLTQSMSDIVWSINPRNDHAEALAGRMRRFARGFLEASGILLRFPESPFPSELRLPVDTRRQLFLIFKELIHNVARHSGATEVTVTLREEKAHLLLEVADNGRGLPPGASESGGQGLAAMRSRAASVGGTLRFDSSSGLRVTLEVPLRKSL